MSGHVPIPAPVQVPMPQKTKPTLALMGEFSAGKSTLCNLLIGSNPLPVKVTATNLPPVWITYGSGLADRVDTNGMEQEADLTRLDEIDPETTQYLRVRQRSKVLEMCDLIDMPGISDPNMPPEVWQRVIGMADAVIWCTHATQAWRQSESAVWDTFPDEIRQRSLLLITRFDKIRGESDRTRVVKRVEAATQGLFHAVFPISLTQALAARKDPSQWEASGAKAFADALVKTVNAVKNGTPLGTAPHALNEETMPDAAATPEDASGNRILPRRIRPGAKLTRPRPKPLPRLEL